MKHTHIFKALLFVASIQALCISATAQRLTDDQIRNQMVKEWERAKAYTISYLNTMPADKYGFKAVDSLRSFAQQMLHLASGNVFLMSHASLATPPAYSKEDIEHSPTAQNKDSVMYFVVNSYDYCIGAIKSLPVDKWGEVIDLFGFKETRFVMLLKTFEHQSHHRGQTTIYIRLQNIIPPQERLFQN
jgi:DinB family